MMRKKVLGAAVALVMVGGLVPAASASTSRDVTIPGNDVWSGCVDPTTATGQNGATSGGNGWTAKPANGCTTP